MDEHLNLVLTVKEVDRVWKVLDGLKKRLDYLEANPVDIKIKLNEAARNKFRADVKRETLTTQGTFSTFQQDLWNPERKQQVVDHKTKTVSEQLRRKDISPSPDEQERLYAGLQKMGMARKDILKSLHAAQKLRLKEIDNQLTLLSQGKRQSKDIKARILLLTKQKAEYSDILTAAKLLTKEAEKRQKVEARIYAKNVKEAKKVDKTGGMEAAGLSDRTIKAIDNKRSRELRAFDAVTEAHKKHMSVREKMERGFQRLKFENLDKYIKYLKIRNPEIIAEGKKIRAALAKQGKFITEAQAIGQAEKQTKQYGNTVKSVTNEEKRASRERINSLKQHENLNRSLDVAIGKLIRYRVAFGAMYKMYQAFTNAIKTFIDVNYELAQIGKVIQPTKKELESIKKTAFELAAAYGQSIDQILKSFKVWGQMGLRQKDLQNAVNATLVASNALGIEATEVTESLTAAIFSYGVETGDLISVIDKWMAVQRQYPITAQDLANGMKKVGVAAHNLGIDMDNLNGMLASIVAVTRKSGREVGNSLKTMFARIPRSQTIRALQDIGVFMMKTKTEFRSLSTVLDDLAERWKTLNDTQKTYIGQQVAGVRRYVDFIALMENYSVKVSATATSQAAFGEAMKANAREMLTFKKQFAELKALFSKFGEAFGSSLAPMMRDFIWIGKQFAKVFSSKVFSGIIKSVIILGGVFTVGKGIVLGYNFVARKLTQGFVSMIPTVKVLTADFIKLGVAENVAAAKAVKLNKVLMVMRRSNVVLLAIGAAVSVFYLLKDAISETSEEMENFSDVLDITPDYIKNLRKTINGQKEQLKAFKGLAKERTQYLAQLKDMKEGSEEYRETVKKLNITNEELGRHSAEIRSATAIYGETVNQTAGDVDVLTDATKRLFDAQKRLIDQTKEELKRKMGIVLMGRTPKEYREETEAQRDALIEYQTNFNNMIADIRKAAEQGRKELSEEMMLNLSIVRPSGDEIGERIGIFKSLKETAALIDKSGLEDKISKIGDNLVLTPTQIEDVKKSYQAVLQLLESTQTDAALKSYNFAKLFYAIPSTAISGYNDMEAAATELNQSLALLDAYLNDLKGNGGDNKFAGISSGILTKIAGFRTELGKLTGSMDAGFHKQLTNILLLNEATGKEYNVTKELLKINETKYKEMAGFIIKLKDEIIGLEAEQISLQKIIDDPGTKSGLFTKTKEDLSDNKILVEKLKEAIEEFKPIIAERMKQLLDAARAQSGLLLLERKNLEQVKSSYRGLTALTKTRASIVKRLSGDEIKGLVYQLDATQQLIKGIKDKISYEKSLGQENSTLGMEYKKQLISAEKMEDSYKIQIQQAKLLKAIEPYAAFKEGFSNAFGSGLGSLQGAWLKNTEERKRLQDEIYYKQQDLNEAIAEGETDAITTARDELSELKEDLEEINEIWRMIGESIRDAFLQLSDKVFQNVMNDIADEFTDMLFTFRTLQDATEGTDIMNLQVDAASAEGNLGKVFSRARDDITGDLESSMANQYAVDNEKNMKKAGDVAGDMIKRKMLSAGGMIAGQLAGALVGGSGPGAAKGASLGTLGGQGAFAAMGPAFMAANPFAGFLLSAFGGAIGGLIGGKSDKDADDHTASIKKNTDAVQSNTNALEELSRIIINAPPRYRLPPMGGGLVAGGVHIETLNVGGGAEGASGFLDTLESYGLDLRTSRSRTRVVI